MLPPDSPLVRETNHFLFAEMGSEKSPIDYRVSGSATQVLPKLHQTSWIQTGLGSCIEYSHNSLVQKLKITCNRLLSTNLGILGSSVLNINRSRQITETVSEVLAWQNRLVLSNTVGKISSDSSLSASSHDEEDEDTEVDKYAQGNLDEFAKSSDEASVDVGDDSGDSDEFGDGELPTVNDDDVERGIIYVRESDISSVEDGRNLDGQIEECKETAEEAGIELVCEPITDEGKTGTNFDREGIREVFVKSQRNVDYLIVDDLSRLGRSAPETLYFIHYMEDTVGVTIMTPRGEINASQVDDLIQATMRSLSNQLATGYRTRASLRSRKNGFVEDRDWSSGYKTVPPGYERDEDSDWIKVNSKEVGAVQTMFEKFAKTGSYATTAKELNEEYGDTLEDPLESWQVKRHLQRAVYIGKPTLHLESEQLDQSEFTAEDPNLQIVSLELFEEVQNKIEEITEKYSTDEETLGPEDAVEMFGLLAVLNASPMVVLKCTEPGCDGELRANGQRELDGTFRGHSYQCKECGKNRKWPYLSEMKEMRGKNEDAGDSENSEEGDT